MDPGAYELGNLDAVLAYGVKTAFIGKGLTALGGGIAGGLAANDPDEAAASAALGAGTAFGLHHAIGSAFGGDKSQMHLPASAAAVPATPELTRQQKFENIGRDTIHEGISALKEHFFGQPKPVAGALPGSSPQQTLMPEAPRRQATPVARPVPVMRYAKPPVAPPARRPAQPDPTRVERLTPEQRTGFVEQGELKSKLRGAFRKGGLTKRGSLDQFKLAFDVSGGIGLPGTGASVGIKDQRERLPGMARWVPRSTVERGFDYADAGTDSEVAAEQEAGRGNLSSPLLGAALAAAGANRFFPKSGRSGAALAGLAGAGLGSLYHNATREARGREGYEAVEGAKREREKFPIQKHQQQTATEASPLAVSRGSGDPA